MLMLSSIIRFYVALFVIGLLQCSRLYGFVQVANIQLLVTFLCIIVVDLVFVSWCSGGTNFCIYTLGAHQGTWNSFGKLKNWVNQLFCIAIIHCALWSPSANCVVLGLWSWCGNGCRVGYFLRVEQLCQSLYMVLGCVVFLIFKSCTLKGKRKQPTECTRLITVVPLN